MKLRKDFLTIIELINENSSVLDLGCGEGELLSLLKNRKKIKAKGIEIDEKKVLAALNKGVTVYHGDFEEILPCYKSKSYDYVILSLTLHEVKNPEKIILEALRVGKNVIISFPNFANIKVRLGILINGRFSDCEFLEYKWYDRKFIHFITVKEFEKFCLDKEIIIQRKIFFPSHGVIAPNLLSTFVIYCLEK